MKPLHSATILAAIVVVGFYILCGYIVHVTGSTTGLPALGDAVAHLINALQPG